MFYRMIQWATGAMGCGPHWGGVAASGAAGVAMLNEIAGH